MPVTSNGPSIRVGTNLMNEVVKLKMRQSKIEGGGAWLLFVGVGGERDAE